MLKSSKTRRTQRTSTSIELTLSVPRPTQQATLLISTLVLLSVMLLSASSSAQTTDCLLERTELQKYKCLAKQANEDSKKANQLAKEAQQREQDALDREDEAIRQRDEWIENTEKARQERDETNGELTAEKRLNLKLSRERDAFLVENSMLEAENKKLKRQRWYWVGGALVLGFVGGGGTALYVVAK